MAIAKNVPSEPSGDREIVISRTFDAPRELVWRAMTEPQHVVNWWGPRGFTTTIEVMDVRPGGHWNHTMRGPDGTNYPNRSVFTEVVKPERIAFSHGGERAGGPGVNFEATWTFDALADHQTKVTIRMVFPSASERDFVVKEFGAIEGAKQTLERLGEQLAREPVVVERTFNAPVEIVWSAITGLEHMKQWYFTSLESFQPEVGFKTRVVVEHEGQAYPHLWQVTEVVPGKKIAYTWKYEGDPGESLLTMELFPEGRQTRLKLTHSGLETFLPESHPKYARGNFVKGWGYFMGAALGEYLEKIGPVTDRAVIITRTFDAPRELVWRAWTEPKHLAQWWGPRDFTNPVCEMEVQPGGTWRVVMRSPDGKEYPLKSTCLKVEPPRLLVLVMDCSEHPVEWHDLVNPNRDKSKPPRLDCVQTVTFEDLGGKTKLTIRTEVESPAIRDAMVKMGMHEGWSESLDRLAGCLLQLTT